MSPGYSKFEMTPTYPCSLIVDYSPHSQNKFPVVLALQQTVDGTNPAPLGGYVKVGLSQ